jgi:hypothetical protein
VTAPTGEDPAVGAEVRGGWSTTAITADIVRGALDLESTALGVLPHRLPARARAQMPDDQLAMAEAQPSGVRLVFRTRSTALELDVLHTKLAYQGAPPRRDGLYDLVVDGRLAGQASVTAGNVRTTDMTTGSVTTRPGAVGTVRAWLHHSSSISHDSNAESPSTTWPALAAAQGGVELVKLGFGGAHCSTRSSPVPFVTRPRT